MLTDLQLQGLKNKCISLINNVKDIDDFDKVGDDIKTLTREYKEKHIKKINIKKILKCVIEYNKKYKTNFINLNKLNIDGFYVLCKNDAYVSSIELLNKYDTLVKSNEYSVDIYYDNVSGVIFAIDFIDMVVKYEKYINNDKEMMDTLKREVTKTFNQIKNL